MARRFLSVFISVHLWFNFRLRLAAPGFLRLLAGIERKCLSMNNLQLKSSFGGQGRSRLIKANRVIFLWCDAPKRTQWSAGVLE
jgi:hypothetical protein